MSDEIREVLRFVQLENVRLKAENRELQQEVAMLRGVLEALQALQDVSASITSSTDALQLLHRILESALVSIGASDGSLMLMDDETEELVFVVIHGELEGLLEGYRIEPGTGIAGWVAANKEMVVVPDVHRDPRFSPDVDQTFGFRTRSMLAVPIIYADNILGVIQALNKAGGDPFNEADLTLLGVVAQLAATAMTNMSKVIEAEPEAEPEEEQETAVSD